MENGNDILKNAEERNYATYEEDVSRRLGEKAWEQVAKNLREAQESNLETPPLGWFYEKPNEESKPAKENEKREQDERATEAIRRYIGSNLLDATKQYSDLSKQVSNLDLLLDIAKQETREKISSRNAVTDSLYSQLYNVKRRLEELPNQTPESYTLVHGLELRKYSEQIKSNQLVTTPYVEEHLERVEKNIEEGRPTFLHGHLGSGKTELARNAAVNATINRAACDEAMKDIVKYHESHPDSTREENTAELGRLYRKYQASFHKAFSEGDSSAREKFTPLFITGAKDLTSQDFFTEKTLKLTKFNGKTVLEHQADLDGYIREWREKHPDEAGDPDKEQRAAQEILDIYKMKNQAFGTEVETIKKEIYRGVTEGRPVIIDEANAIPAAVLISLNDILTGRPGGMCYIEGEGNKMIQPGFSLILTGNLSSNTINYNGTEDLNPAFLSRLDIIEHDYLPMSETDSSYKEQANPDRNELFKVVISYLTDRQGNLELPEMEKSLDKIFSLCQLAHATQAIFENKWRESNVLSDDSGDSLEPRLNEAVLSMRNLINVLIEWNKGFEKDIDKALWDGFVSGITDADDQNMFLALAKHYGFFSKWDGWNIELKERGNGLTSWNEAHPEPYYYRKTPMETYSVRKVIEALYGPGPERDFYPPIDFDTLEDGANDEMSIEDLEKFKTKIEEINNTIKALEVLGEQCGCSIEAHATN